MEAEASLAITYATKRLAERIANDPLRFGLLTQDFSVTLTAGVGTILSSVGSISAVADVLWDTIPRNRVADSESTKLIYVPNLADFEGKLLAGYLYYTLSNQRIIARSNVTGSYTADLLTGTLTVTANFIPTISTLPTQLDNELVNTLAEVLSEKMAAAS